MPSQATTATCADYADRTACGTVYRLAQWVFTPSKRPLQASVCEVSFARSQGTTSVPRNKET